MNPKKRNEEIHNQEKFECISEEIPAPSYFSQKTGEKWKLVQAPDRLETYSQLLEALKRAEGRRQIYCSLDIVINLEDQYISCRGLKISLQFMQIVILEVLLTCPQMIVSRNLLLDLFAYRYHRAMLNNSLSVGMNRVRSRIRHLTSRKFIGTKNAHGYFWKYPVYRLDRMN